MGADRVPEPEKIHDKEIGAKARLVIIGKDLGTDLITVAECLKDAARDKVSIVKFFETHSGRQVMETNRDWAKDYTDSLENREIRKFDTERKYGIK